MSRIRNRDRNKPRRVARQAEARVRFEKASLLTPKQRLEKLDRSNQSTQFKPFRAVKERTRLVKIIQAHKADVNKASANVQKFETTQAKGPQTKQIPARASQKNTPWSQSSRKSQKPRTVK